MPSRPMRFARQALALQVALIVLVVVVGFLLVAVLLDRTMVDQFGQRAVGVARAVATDSGLADAVVRGDQPQVQQQAERARASTGALFVVVTDRAGTRLSHPDPDEVGAPVSTDPRPVLAGREVVDVQRGTLGPSARGKVPLRTSDGAIVGLVSVGFDSQDITAAFLRLAGMAAAFLGGALVLGLAGADRLTRMLKRRTLGLEPQELTELVRQREAVLYGIGEGVLAVDRDGRVSVCNSEAERLLGITIESDVPLESLDLPSRLREVLSERRAVTNLITIAGERVLVVSYRSVVREGTDLGGVLTLRDRTDLEALSQELDAVRGMADTLRAQRHEFTNRLHTLSGLLQTGRHEDAVEYVQVLASGSVAGLGEAADAVRDPYLVAFLSAKKAAASEKGVQLELGESSWVPTATAAPVEVMTVVANLVDNAIDAARVGTSRHPRVEVDLVADGATLHVSVVDSGDGVPDSVREQMFTEGISSKAREGRGWGLALSRQAARTLGGDVSLVESEVTEDTVFVAVLPGAVSFDVEEREAKL